MFNDAVTELRYVRSDETGVANELGRSSRIGWNYEYYSSRRLNTTRTCGKPGTIPTRKRPHYYGAGIAEDMRKFPCGSSDFKEWDLNPLSCSQFGKRAGLLTIRTIHIWGNKSYNKKFSEQLIYFPLIRHEPHRKQFFYCCVCICCCVNVFNEQLPRNDRGCIYRHKLKYASQVGSVATIYIPRFITTGSVIQKLMGETQTAWISHKRTFTYLLTYSWS
jgi:hypothetical protein